MVGYGKVERWMNLKMDGWVDGWNDRWIEDRRERRVFPYVNV